VRAHGRGEQSVSVGDGGDGELDRREERASARDAREVHPIVLLALLGEDVVQVAHGVLAPIRLGQDEPVPLQAWARVWVRVRVRVRALARVRVRVRVRVR
jgi:hypothetical protein